MPRRLPPDVSIHRRNFGTQVRSAAGCVWSVAVDQNRRWHAMVYFRYFPATRPVWSLDLRQATTSSSLNIQSQLQQKQAADASRQPILAVRKSDSNSGWTGCYQSRDRAITTVWFSVCRFLARLLIFSRIPGIATIDTFESPSTGFARNPINPIKVTVTVFCGEGFAKSGRKALWCFGPKGQQFR